MPELEITFNVLMGLCDELHHKLNVALNEQRPE